ncbi:MAG TPA: transketolase C-terminal domain-containing protein, partial [Ignavibacteriaceae bacterium]|nr:transketolase C-terminal domain-containing protein [Ignavibacteriaceae bacterium]
KTGDDVALLAVGSMVNYSLKAAEKLANEGINCEVINVRFIKPLDAEMLNYIAGKHSKIVTLEESTLIGGFGSAVLEYFNEKNFKNDILRIGLPDHFVEHGTQKELHRLLKMDPDSIVERVKIFCKNNIIKREISI